MRLQAWDISVIEGDAGEINNILTIETQIIRWWATVRVGTFFEKPGPTDRTIPREERRQAAVHEMLHIHQAALFDWVRDGSWKQSLSASDALNIESRIKFELEVQTDAMARTLAQFMPYGPDEWDDEPSG